MGNIILSTFILSQNKMKKFYNYLPFLALFILPLLFYPVVDSSGWRSNSDVHALLEFAASLLAITAGIMVLLHFFTTGRWFFLIISIGFIQIGTEELIHAVFSFSRILPGTIPDFRLAISSTWLAGQFILVTSFFIAFIFGKRKVVQYQRKMYAIACNIIGLIFAASVTLLIFHADFLPVFIQIGSGTKKIVELSLAVLFFIAFIFYSGIYLKQESHSPLLWGIIACIIFRVLAHIYVFDAKAFYDSHWDSAHLLVLLSYFFPIFGVWGETIKLHRSVQEQVSKLSIEIVRRKQAEKELKKSEKRFRHISSTISDISYSCLMNKNGHYSIDWISGASERITGYTLDEIKAKGCWGKLVVEEDMNIFKKNILDLAPGKSSACELRLRKKNGPVVWIASFAECLKELEPPSDLYLFGALVNITERKQVEEELQQKVTELQKFHDLTVDRELMMVRLKKEVNELLLKNGQNKKYRLIKSKN